MAANDPEVDAGTKLPIGDAPLGPAAGWINAGSPRFSKLR